MNKLFVGILIVSVLIGILTVIPENVRAETWSIETVDSDGDVGWYTSIALDNNGYPHISYWDRTNDDLKYAKWTGSEWDTETVDSAGNVGYYTSIALDNKGYPHISYYDGTNDDLKYAKWTGSEWDAETVDSAGNVGKHTSIALDNNNYPHISYCYGTNGDLKYAKWTGSEWSKTTVDWSVGKHTSIALDNNNYPHISYGTNDDLKYAKLATTTVPTLPRNLKVHTGDGYVQLSWDAPDDDDDGAAITKYNIYRGRISQGESLLTTVGNVLTYTDEDVINDRTYYYQVSAVNFVGEGKKSEVVPATPTPGVTATATLAPVPSDPLELKATGGNHEVKLEWKKPEDDGGAAITNYTIYRGTTPGGGRLLKTVGDVRTYTDKNLKNGQTYYYQVSAVNSFGKGGKSHSVEAIPKLDWTFIAVLIGAAAAIIAAIINYLVSRKRRYGSISATSSPDGARVFLDGVDKGESPLTMGKIRKGTRIVLFSKSGYSDCEKRVVVNADQITSVHCDLKKPEMKLVLSADPIEIPADGKSKSVITIRMEDENSTPAPVPEEMTIVLETNIGLIDTPVRIPARETKATSILTSSTASGTATVRVKSEIGLEGSVAVRFA